MIEQLKTVWLMRGAVKQSHVLLEKLRNGGTLPDQGDQSPLRNAFFAIVLADSFWIPLHPRGEMAEGRHNALQFVDERGLCRGMRDKLVQSVRENQGPRLWCHGQAMFVVLDLESAFLTHQLDLLVFQ